MMNSQRFECTLIIAILFVQTLAGLLVAKRSNNYYVDEWEGETEGVNDIAELETRVEEKRAIGAIVGTVIDVVGKLKTHFRERAVAVINRTGGNLWVGCASADNRIGDRTIADQQAIGWKFRPNIWGSTLFWCKVRFNGKEKQFTSWKRNIDKADKVIWDVYSARIDSNVGQEYEW